MITEDYVDFETAKLLKEKGFEQFGCHKQYNTQGDLCSGYCYGPVAPTLQMAMKWLREVHNLEIYPYHNDPTIINSKWWFEIIKWPNSSFEYESGEDEEYDTYEEACEAAIKYCLENLI